MSSTMKQVSEVLDRIIDCVCKKKRVTWHKDGITKAMTFEIEPWRKILTKPYSTIREIDCLSCAPFTLPKNISHIEPYFDYDTYRNDNYNLRPRKEVLVCSPPIYDMPIINCSLDNDSTGPLVRCEPISLDKVYKIAEDIKNNLDYEKFINESE